MMETDKVLIGSLRDKYVQQLPLMGSPIPLTLILISYYLFILKIGPNLMKNRPAYDLKKLLMFYNAVQVLFSSKLVYDGISYIGQYGVFDRECVWEENYTNIIFSGYLYIMAKISELLDTVFFVLRKKQNQVSFLHVYHHTIMVVAGWLVLKYEISYALVFSTMLNTFVHVIMYTYYGLAAFPALRKYLWWKRYLTKLQLAQFAVCFIQTILFMMISNCPLSYILFGVITFNLFLFIFLFSKFYINAYLRNEIIKVDMSRFVCSNVDQNNNDSEFDAGLNSNSSIKYD